MLRLILKLLLYFIIFNIITQPIQSLAFPKSNLDRIDPNSLHVNYDEYPMVVPKKRAGNINTLYRLMVALHNVLEEDEDDHSAGNSKKYNRIFKNTNYDENDLKKFKSINKAGDEYDEDIESNEQHSIQFDESMDLQRRGQIGQNKGRVYWRCYFNAVSCF